ncbi:MAG: sulfite exporter TauE/SafE family protein [Nanoarchaeota archaeon]|nr:sulfite exporter TauE/SafE family protein [Nanoarchaeota archaeon]
MEPISILIVIFVGLIGGAYGTLVGGGFLIIIPALIFLGLPPHVALGTARLGGLGSNSAGWYKFHKKGYVNYKTGLIIAIPVFFGALIGANIVINISETILRYVVGIITLVILIFMVLKPDIGMKGRRKAIKHHNIIGVIISFILGIYGGFYGAGLGTFLTYLLVLLFGQTFLESAGTRKISAFFMNIVPAVVFAMKGLVNFYIGIVLFLATFTGSYIGAHYSDRIGDIWIKRLFFVVVLIMAVKLLI